MEIFEAIAAERLALADVVDGLNAEQLTAPSLCAQWSVGDVVAHVVMPLVTPMSQFMFAMLKAAGNFEKANVALTERVARRGDGLTTLLREHAQSHFTPPGAGPEAPLSDILIHGQDIRRPLGISRDFDPERMVVVLDFLLSPKASRGFVDRRRIRGLRFEADDIGWSGGDGATVRGPGEAIMLVLTGRDVALPELSGEGVALLSTD